MKRERVPRFFFDANMKAPWPRWKRLGVQIQWLRRVVVKISIEWRGQGNTPRFKITDSTNPSSITPTIPSEFGPDDAIYGGVPVRPKKGANE